MLLLCLTSRTCNCSILGEYSIPLDCKLSEPYPSWTPLLHHIRSGGNHYLWIPKPSLPLIQLGSHCVYDHGECSSGYTCSLALTSSHFVLQAGHNSSIGQFPKASQLGTAAFVLMNLTVVFTLLLWISLVGVIVGYNDGANRCYGIYYDRSTGYRACKFSKQYSTSNANDTFPLFSAACYSY